MSGAQSVLVTRRVQAPVPVVWAAFTETERLARWWWPQLPDTTYALDPRVGGAYRFRSDAAGIGVRGRVVRLEAPHLLELTWTWEDGDDLGPEERVVVTLVQAEGDAGATQVRVEHWADPASAAGYVQGWSDCLVRLPG